MGKFQFRIKVPLRGSHYKSTWERFIFSPNPGGKKLNFTKLFYPSLSQKKKPFWPLLPLISQYPPLPSPPPPLISMQQQPANGALVCESVMTMRNMYEWVRERGGKGAPPPSLLLLYCTTTRSFSLSLSLCEAEERKIVVLFTRLLSSPAEGRKEKRRKCDHFGRQKVTEGPSILSLSLPLPRERGDGGSLSKTSLLLPLPFLPVSSPSSLPHPFSPRPLMAGAAKEAAASEFEVHSRENR